MIRPLLSLLLLLGCGGPRPVHAGNVRPEYQQAADVAIAEWNAALGCRALKRDDDARPAFARLYEVDSHGKWAARTFMQQHRIDIAPDTVGPYAVRALEHELGHLFGLKHSPDATHLMWAGAPIGTRGPESTGLTCKELR